MKLKLTHSIERAAVKSGFSRDTGYRINKDRRLPSQKPKVPRGRRRSDPLAGIFEEQVVPMLEQCPNLRAVAVYREVMRLNLDFVGNSIFTRFSGFHFSILSSSCKRPC